MLLAALLTPILTVLAVGDDLPRSDIAERELKKLSKAVDLVFDAMADEQRRDAKAVERKEKAFQDLLDDYEKAARARKVSDPLRFVGDWEYVMEHSKPEVRELKSQVGKGFFRYDWHDELDASITACLLSIPADYGKAETFFPAIVALKPPLGLEGADLEARVQAMAEAMYSDLMASTIILIPVGPGTGSGRNAVSTEIETSWMTDEGIATVFQTLRVLLEQLHFDRARVVVDGWGGAGEDALRFVTSFPSWFAGVIDRSGGIGGDEMIFENLVGVPLLYVNGAGDGSGVDTEALAQREDVPAGVTVIDDEGSSLEPSGETRSAIAAWVAERRRDLAPDTIRYKLGDIRLQSVNWLKATDISRRATASPDDDDFPRIEARIDRAANRISIDTVNVFGLWVYLSDALVDMSRPVTIVVNGEERQNRTFTRNLRYLIENRFLNNSGDYGLYTAEALVTEIDPNLPEVGGEDG